MCLELFSYAIIRAGDFSSNKMAGTLDIFFKFASCLPTFLTSAIILKSSLEYYIEMSAYDWNTRLLFSFFLKGFRCETIIIKIHFKLIFLSFSSQTKCHQRLYFRSC